MEKRAIEKLLLMEVLEEVNDYSGLELSKEELLIIQENCEGMRDKKEIETTLNKSLIKLGYELDYESFMWIKLKTYKVPLTWEVCGVLEVNARSIEEAFAIAIGPDSPLPNEGDYVDGSIQLSYESEEYMRIFSRN